MHDTWSFAFAILLVGIIVVLASIIGIMRLDDDCDTTAQITEQGEILYRCR